MFGSITSQTKVHRASRSQTLGKKQSLSQPSSWRGSCVKSQETLSKGKSLGSVQLAIPLWAGEEGARVTLLCFSPPAGGVTAGSHLQLGIPSKQPSGFSGLSQEWTCLWDAPEDTKVVHLHNDWLAAVPSTAQHKGPRHFCCQLHFQMSITDPTMLISRTYKYLHYDWHVVVFLLATRSFPLTSG